MGVRGCIKGWLEGFDVAAAAKETFDLIFLSPINLSNKRVWK